MATETKVRGILKSLKAKEGYAFITDARTGEDYFMHRSAVAATSPQGWEELVEDMVVEFTPFPSPKGLRAMNVRVITEQEQFDEAEALRQRREAEKAAGTMAEEQARAAEVEQRKQRLLAQNGPGTPVRRRRASAS